jgi:hypothetical protein
VKEGKSAAVRLHTRMHNMLKELGKSAVGLAMTLVGYLLKTGTGRKADNKDDHRPISRFSVPGKIEQHLLRLDLQDALEGGLSDAQFAERKGFGAELALFVILSFLHSRKGKKTLVALVDIKSAYDATWKPGLWLKLYAMGVRGKLWSLMVSMMAKFPTQLTCDD